MVKLAQPLYDDRRFEDLPILADALEDAGCHDADILAHCRGRGPIRVVAGSWICCWARSEGNDRCRLAGLG